MKLTARQEQVLGLIANTINEKGMPPTRAEIAEILGFRSPNAAEEHLKALARKGAVEIIPGTSRGIRILGSAPIGLPLVGRVAAGLPILAQENIGRYLNISPTLFHPQADFLLEVEGDSMKDAGIFGGDLIALRRSADAKNNQIVVARVNDEVTVKRYKRCGSVVTLYPENRIYSPLKVDLKVEAFAIEGVLVGSIRTHCA